ncbi:MAG: SUMF1/EgtB/PvdO family nonheme iron enzyme [Bacteroidota bacterium]
MTSTLRSSETPEVLAARMADARARTDEIFKIVSPDALYERAIPERHRLAFYLGHVEAFDGNLLRQAWDLASFNPVYDKLFAFGIDPVDGALPSEAAEVWPRPEPIRSYNGRIREAVDECLAGKRPLAAGHDAATILNMAIEHRLMHAETLAYLIHQLPYKVKHGKGDPPAPKAAAGDLTRKLRIPAGKATLGRTRSSGVFGWDNEFQEKAVDVPAFDIDAHKVTNGQFEKFVEAGGYENKSYWTPEDWAWKEEQKLKHPFFWSKKGKGWKYHGMFADSDLSPNAPVYVSHAEAAAYARWTGRALPTEGQFHRAAYGTPTGEEREYPWGNERPAEKHGNFDFHRWDPTPVGSYPAGASAFGVQELVGNGWEWTSSVFEPFPGFEAHPFYKGYSADFFDGKHYVMKGGSPRTAACMLRRSFRNWFQPRYPYVYASFRTVGV